MTYQEYLNKIKKFFNDLSLLSKASLLVLSILLLIVAVYLINPAKKLRDMRNSQRRNDVVMILDAVYQYYVDNGQLPAGIDGNPKMICRAKAASCQGMIDLSQVSSIQKYQLLEIPVDPREKDPNKSGYEIYRSASGRINVIAPGAENATISLSK